MNTYNLRRWSPLHVGDTVHGPKPFVTPDNIGVVKRLIDAQPEEKVVPPETRYEVHFCNGQVTVHERHELFPIEACDPFDPMWLCNKPLKEGMLHWCCNCDAAVIPNEQHFNLFGLPRGVCPVCKEEVLLNYKVDKAHPIYDEPVISVQSTNKFGPTMYRKFTHDARSGHTDTGPWVERASL
jgi:hypothetical protein